MKNKLSIRNFFIYATFMILITGNIFTQQVQSPALTLDTTDVRFEILYSNNVITGYDIFVRKKAGIESVILTEPRGFSALRSLEWNAINGDERRELNGILLNDIYSRFSILSSTPIPDSQFGEAFRLFLPLKVIYSAEAIAIDINPGVQINIRAYERKYADPNRSRFQNNIFNIVERDIPSSRTSVPQQVAPPKEENTDNDRIFEELRRALKNIGINEATLNLYSNSELQTLLKGVFGS